MIRTFRNGDRIIDDPKNDFIIYEPSRLTGPLTTEHDPVGVRSALRKVGVERIIIKPVADGWTFEGVADLGRLVNNKGKTAPPSPPTLGDAPAQPGRPSKSLRALGPRRAPSPRGDAPGGVSAAGSCRPPALPGSPPPARQSRRRPPLPAGASRPVSHARASRDLAGPRRDSPARGGDSGRERESTRLKSRHPVISYAR